MADEQPATTSLSSDAVRRLVGAHREFLGFLQKRVESREVAEDILQSAFVRVLERGGEVRDEETVVAWFYRMLRNAVIDHYRRRASTERVLDLWAKEFNEAVEPDLETEICQCVSGLMSSLKQEYREALQIVDLGEGSLNELAKVAGITPGNAAVRVHRAREALRKQVASACGTCVEHGCLDCHCS